MQREVRQYLAAGYSSPLSMSIKTERAMNNRKALFHLRRFGICGDDDDDCFCVVFAIRGQAFIYDIRTEGGRNTPTLWTNISMSIKTCKQKGVGGGQTIQKVGDVMYGSPPTEKRQPEEGELG